MAVVTKPPAKPPICPPNFAPTPPPIAPTAPPSKPCPNKSGNAPLINALATIPPPPPPFGVAPGFGGHAGPIDPPI